LRKGATPNFALSSDFALPYSCQQVQIIVRIVLSVATFAAKCQKSGVTDWVCLNLWEKRRSLLGEDWLCLKLWEKRRSLLGEGDLGFLRRGMNTLG
jgi:hypothetical protein